MTLNDNALINAFSTTSSTLNTICAFQFEAIDNITDVLNITFKNNSFPERNHTIIGELIMITPAYHCVQTYSSRRRVNMTKVYNKIFGSPSTMIRSVPVKVYLCNNDGVTENNQSRTNIYPGTPVIIDVAVKDEGGHIVPANVLTQLQENELQFSPVDSIKEFNHYNHCARFSYKIHTISTQSTTGHLLISVLHKQPTLKVKFQIQQCPIGFELQKGMCHCNKFIQAIERKGLAITCNLTIKDNNISAVVEVANVNLYWLGIGNVKTITTNLHNISLLLVSGLCPFGNCNFSKVSVNLLVNDSLCIGERMGQLCSECKPGYSIVFGSTQCYICTNIWLLTIMLYAFLGILLVGLLRFTIDHCIVTSLILYGNIATFGLMDLVGVDPHYIEYESIFLSLINLNIGRRSVVFSNWISNRSV